MHYVWKVDLESVCYAGDTGRCEEVEGVELYHNDINEWYQNRKRYFEKREDAEAYVEPLAKKAYKFLISDMEDDDEMDDDGTKYNADTIATYLERGLTIARQEELEEDHQYRSKEPKTIYAVLPAWVDDRDGEIFAKVIRVKIH